MIEHECIYALLESRRVTTAQTFLDRYLPTRKHAAVEKFEFPQFAVSSDTVFSNSYGLLAHLEADPEQSFQSIGTLFAEPGMNIFLRAC